MTFHISLAAYRGIVSLYQEYHNIKKAFLKQRRGTSLFDCVLMQSDLCLTFFEELQRIHSHYDEALELLLLNAILFDFYLKQEAIAPLGIDSDLLRGLTCEEGFDWSMEKLCEHQNPDRGISLFCIQLLEDSELQWSVQESLEESFVLDEEGWSRTYRYTMDSPIGPILQRMNPYDKLDRFLMELKQEVAPKGKSFYKEY